MYMYFKKKKYCNKVNQPKIAHIFVSRKLQFFFVWEEL